MCHDYRACIWSEMSEGIATSRDIKLGWMLPFARLQMPGLEQALLQSQGLVLTTKQTLKAVKLSALAFGGCQGEAVALSLLKPLAAQGV